jgi:hypothetical protein
MQTEKVLGLSRAGAHGRTLRKKLRLATYGISLLTRFIRLSALSISSAAWLISREAESLSPDLA